MQESHINTEVEVTKSKYFVIVLNCTSPKYFFFWLFFTFTPYIFMQIYILSISYIVKNMLIKKKRTQVTEKFVFGRKKDNQNW